MATEHKIEVFLSHLRDVPEKDQKYDKSVKAHARVRVDDHLLIKGLHVIEKSSGTKVIGFPGDNLSSLWKVVKTPSNVRYTTFRSCDIDAELRDKISIAVLTAYNANSYQTEGPELTEDGEWRQKPLVIDMSAETTASTRPGYTGFTSNNASNNGRRFSPVFAG